MPRALRRFACLFLGALLANPAALTVNAAEHSQPAELLFGSVAADIPAVMNQRLKPLADYLGRELGRPVSLRLAPDLARAAEEVAAGAVDISYLTPVAYLRAHERGGVRLIAKVITQGRSSLKLMIVTRADSAIQNPRDLAGKTFAFGDPAAILQRAVVVNAGVRLEELGSYKFIGHYDNIARGVANGDFDAGILKDTTAYDWMKKGLRIIHTSPDLPPYNIAVSSKLDEGLARTIQAALLSLDGATPEHRRIIKSLDQSYDGFARASDGEYDAVRKMIKPFEK